MVCKQLIQFNVGLKNHRALNENNNINSKCTVTWYNRDFKFCKDYLHCIKNNVLRKLLLSYRPEVPNLFMTVAHFHFENFPWLNSQSFAQTKISNFFGCNLQKNEEKKISRQKPHLSANFLTISDGKEGHLANTFFNQNPVFQTPFWLTAKCLCGTQVENNCYR